MPGLVRLHALHATIRFGGKTQFVTGARVIVDPASLPQSIVMTVVPGETTRGSSSSDAKPNTGVAVGIAPRVE